MKKLIGVFVLVLFSAIVIGCDAEICDEECQAEAESCVSIEQEECEERYYCSPVFGAPLLEDCSEGKQEYAGCRTRAIKEESGQIVVFACVEVETWAHRAAETIVWLHFEDTCVPDGWSVAELTPPECDSL